MRRATSYAVKVRATTEVHAAVVSTTATLAVRSKQWMTLEVKTPAESDHGALDWVCEVRGRTLRAYDTRRRAYIQRTFDQPLSAAAGLSTQFGTMIPDAISRFMTPEQLGDFFTRFVGLTGWNRTVARDTLTWKYKNASGAVAFSFSRGSGRLMDWQIHGSTATSWKLSYPALAAVLPLRVPADAVLVESFRLPPARPKIADPGARHTVNRCFDAYERAFQFRATVAVDGARYDLWRNGGTVEEIGPAGGWRWSHGTLTLWPRAGGVVSGPTRLSRVRSYLAQFKLDAEPLALALINDDNYAGTLFTADYTVKKVGSVTLAGDPLSLLRVSGPAVRFDLSVDSKGLIRRIDSTAYDGAGRRMSETVRQISYGALGTPAAAPTTQALPLPKLKAPPKPPYLPPAFLRGGH